MVDRFHVGLVIMKTRHFLIGIALLVLASATAVAAGSNGAGKLPPAKQAMEDKIAAMREAASANGAAKVAPADLPNDRPEPAPALGGTVAGVGRMYSDADTMRPPGYPDDTFTNSWSVTSDTVNIDVWAAARAADPRRGFLLIIIWNSDRTAVIGGGEYEPSAARGALRILGAQGSNLSIGTLDGTTFSLDPARAPLN